MESKRLYNLGAISQMVDGDAEQIQELNQLFLKVAPDMLSDINNYWSSRDYEKLANAAHKFKSSIRLWCIDNAFEDILKIEHNSNSLTELESMQLLIERFNITINSVLKQMEEDFASK